MKKVDREGEWKPSCRTGIKEKKMKAFDGSVLMTIKSHHLNAFSFFFPLIRLAVEKKKEEKANVRWAEAHDAHAFSLSFFIPPGQERERSSDLG